MNREQRQSKLASLTHLKAKSEKAYYDMYDAHSFREASDCYRDAKDSFYDAIGLAGELGLEDEKDALSQRLAHIKAVFHSQFAA